MAAIDEAKAPFLPSHFSSGRPFKSILNNSNLRILVGPLSCLLVVFFVDLGDDRRSSRNMLAVLAWVFLWWIAEAVPMAVASMVPLFLFPLLGIAEADAVAKSYMDDVIALLLGSFILALAVQHYDIHRRLALNITAAFCGDPVKPRRLLLGLCGTTAFVSMWMHNTAAAAMMVPVATGILQRLPEGEAQPEVKKFCKGVMLGVIYGAAVGGMSTLTGTGVNLILVGMWETYYPHENPISFSTWSLFALPLAVLIFLALWGILCFFYVSDSSSTALSSYLDRAHLRRELQSLGPMDFAEKMIIAVFGALVVLWMTRSLTNEVSGWGALFHGRVGDGTVSVMMATLLFVIPSKRKEGEKLMDWSKCRELQWSVILLLGAGFAIADGVRTSGLADVLSSYLAFLWSAPRFAVIPLVCLISGTITEFVSNNATATLVVPLLVELARPMKLHPLILMIPGAIGAQFAFLLPTGTPSNTVGFATGYIQIKDMITTGIPLKIAAIAALSLLMPTLGAFVFQTNRNL